MKATGLYREMLCNENKGWVTLRRVINELFDMEKSPYTAVGGVRFANLQ